MKWTRKIILFQMTMSLLIYEVAFAHARLQSNTALTPRNTSAGLKSAPCGGIARTNTPKVLQAGTQITVQWVETINHPGRYEFYFSEANDQNFKLLKTVPDTQDDSNTPHSYSTTLTVPSVNCTACTIQMIQVMTENPDNPSNYYSCADIQIVGGQDNPTEECN